MREQEETDIFETGVTLHEDELSFVSSHTICVCVVDIIDSTRIILGLDSTQKVRKYISTFINSIAAIARKFGAKIMKTAGDSVIFYFPETSDSSNKEAIKKAFDCFAAMSAEHPLINDTLQKEGLPPVSYRISADYGRVEVGKSTTSKVDDLFGPTMIVCYKINTMARRNGIVIGEDLFRIARSLRLDKSRKFVGKGSYPTGLKFPYPVYEVL